MDFLKGKDKTINMQKTGLANGLTCFPEILGLVNDGSRIVKLSEWIDGEIFTTLFESGSLDENMFFMLGDQVGRMNNIKNSKGASLHNDDLTFRNMVWTDKPVIIDMDRTSYDPRPDNSLVKILLKRIIDRNFINAFLEGYSQHRDVSNLSALCEARNWTWKR
jgi:tRNA A-37 threonylcarbamoyl transferase component Bud32